MCVGCLVLEQCRESCGCTHTALLNLSPPNHRTTPSLSHLTQTAYASLATAHSHHLAQTPTHHTYPTSIPPNHFRTNSTPTNPTRPSSISTALRTLSYPQTHPAPSQPETLPHLNPTHLPHHNHSTYYCTSKTSPFLSLFAHPAAETLVSPSKEQMQLGRFCCVLTIQYKCKISNKAKNL